MELEAIALDWDTPSWTDVEAHRYRPPGAFIEAVGVCPIPGTEEYGKAVTASRELNLQRARARLRLTKCQEVPPTPPRSRRPSR